MIIPIQTRNPLRKNTGNIHKFINKIPVDAHKLAMPSSATQYVNREIEEYTQFSHQDAEKAREKVIR